jgi:Predicted dehydrogenases and related proteins
MEKFLVVGLGSMGKRRIRCLLTMGKKKQQIVGLDLRKDRCEEVESTYEVVTYSDASKIDFTDIKAVIVSLPPDKHFVGAKLAIDHNLPVFIEASVLLDDVKNIINYNDKKVFIAPSYTMAFHPMIKIMKNIIKSERYGKICNFSYHCGQYLPDWHPWEKVTDFYVGNRITGGAREIVPFELTWIVNMLGFPSEIKGYFRKTMDLGCDIEDTYVCNMVYESFVGSMVVDVVARYAIRNLIINLERGQVQWNWDEKKIKLYDAQNGNWIYIEQPITVHQTNYNVNINENMYVEELTAFLEGVNDHSKYDNNLEKDLLVLQLLCDIENSDGGFDR